MELDIYLWRLKWYPRAALLAFALGFALMFLTGSGAQIISGRLGGDFPAFYGAARTVLSGTLTDLYKPTRQAASQKDLYGSESEGFLPFAYPPFFAILCAPLALLPYRPAFFIFAMLNVGFFLLAMRSFRSWNQDLGIYSEAALALCIFYYPIFRSLINGQNTALTLMLLAFSIKYTHQEKFATAGLFWGLLAYKPQLGLPFTGLLLVSRRYKLFGWAMLSVLMQFLLVCIFYGTSWVAEWLAFIGWFSTNYGSHNNQTSIGLISFLKAILGSDSTIASYTGLILFSIILVFICHIWIKGDRATDIHIQTGLTVPCILLISPHALYYDAGLLLLSFSAAYGISRHSIWKSFLLCWLVSFSQLFENYLNFSPIFFVLIYVLAYSIVKLYPMATQAGKSQNDQALPAR